MRFLPAKLHHGEMNRVAESSRKGRMSMVSLLRPGSRSFLFDPGSRCIAGTPERGDPRRMGPEACWKSSPSSTLRFSVRSREPPACRATRRSVCTSNEEYSTRSLPRRSVPRTPSYSHTPGFRGLSFRRRSICPVVDQFGRFERCRRLDESAYFVLSIGKLNFELAGVGQQQRFEFVKLKVRNESIVGDIFLQRILQNPDTFVRVTRSRSVLVAWKVDGKRYRSNMVVKRASRFRSSLIQAVMSLLACAYLPMPPRCLIPRRRLVITHRTAAKTFASARWRRRVRRTKASSV